MLDLVLDHNSYKEAVILEHPFLANRFKTIPPINKLCIEDGALNEYYGKLDWLEGDDARSDDSIDLPDEIPTPMIAKNAGGVTVGDVYLKCAKE